MFQVQKNALAANNFPLGHGGLTMAHYLAKKVYINEQILGKLEAESIKNGISLNTLLNHIFKKYLENNTYTAPDVEKRRFARKKVVIPALIYEKISSNGGNGENVDMGRYLFSTILDISMGGLRLVMPADNNGKMEFLKKKSDFEVISYLSGSETLFRFKCRPKHVEKNDNAVKVGSSFIEGENPQQQDLEGYLAK